MGDTVKAIVAIGLIAFSGGLFALGSITATTIIAGSITYGTIAYTVGLGLVALALAPDIGDIIGTESYAGLKLTTRKDNVSPVPIVYGKHKLAGNIIFEDTNSVVNADSSTAGYNRDYWALVVFSGHGFSAQHNVYAGEDELTTVQGISQTSTSEYVHIKMFNTMAGAVNLQSLNFVKNEAGDYITGSELGFASATIPANLTGFTVHQVYDSTDNLNTQLRALTVLWSFKKMRTLTNATTISTFESYSTNPAEIVLDLLGEALSIPDEDIDIATFYAAKVDCAANNWNCSIALVQQANIQSIIQDVLATCRGRIVHSADRWKLKIDTKSQSSVATLDDDDFIHNSLSIYMSSNAEIANKIILRYINPDDEWLSAEVVKEDTTLQNTLDGQTIEKVIDIKGITDATHAGELAEIALNVMRYSEDSSGNRVRQTPLLLTFSTTVKNAELEVGDMITINSDLLDRNRQFIILSTETDQSGLIQITTREYAETHYKDSSGNYLI